MLVFDRAHAQYQEGGFISNDRLVVEVSTDCGQAWSSVYDRAGANLATRTPSGTWFFPTPSQWVRDTIDLSAYDGSSELYVRFRAISDWGNNLYLDNIIIDGDLINAVDEPGQLAGNLSVFPNPTNGPLTIDVNLLASTDAMTIQAFDLAGKQVETILDNAAFPAGSHRFSWTAPAQGVYLIRVATENGTTSQKVIVTN